MPEQNASPTAATAAGSVRADPVDHVVRLQHQIEIDGRAVRYTSTTGRLVLRRERLGTDERAGR